MLACVTTARQQPFFYLNCLLQPVKSAGLGRDQPPAACSCFPAGRRARGKDWRPDQPLGRPGPEFLLARGGTKKRAPIIIL